MICVPYSDSYYGGLISATEVGRPGNLDYDQINNYKYLVGYSLREDVLYNNGETPSVHWSKTFNVVVGKSGSSYVIFELAA